jgi:hypothetical protein
MTNRDIQAAVLKITRHRTHSVSSGFIWFSPVRVHSCRYPSTVTRTPADFADSSSTSRRAARPDCTARRQPASGSLGNDGSNPGQR